MALRIIAVIATVFALVPDNVLGQMIGACEYPSLGYYRVLNKDLEPFSEIYELVLGYPGSDQTEMPVSRFGGLRLKGYFLVRGQPSGGPTPPPDFEITGVPNLPSDLFKVKLKSGKLTISRDCSKTFSIVSRSIKGRTYIVSGVFLQEWVQEKGRLYKAIATVSIEENGIEVSRTKAKLVNFRE